MNDIAFSPSGKVAYQVTQGKQWALLFDGALGPTYDHASAMCLTGEGAGPDARDVLTYLMVKGDSVYRVRHAPLQGG